jgi:hypothetical protein
MKSFFKISNGVKKVFLLSFLIFFFLFLRSFSCQAVEPLSVVINEIAWMGDKVEGVESKNWWRYEWLDLYNNTQNLVSLDGWKLELYRTDLDWVLELRGEIQPRSYFLIVASDKIFPNYDLNYENLGGKFVNTGQKVLLKDSSGNIIDSLDCFSYGKWFAGDNTTKQTMERKNPGLLGDDFLSWATSKDPGGTKKAENSVFLMTNNEEPTTKESSEKEIIKEPEPIQNTPTEVELPPKEEKINYPAGIVINEILPSPNGPDEEEEWIEISNQNNFDVDLSGWKISDGLGKTVTFVFPKENKILANGFFVLDRPTTKITLNNDGDSLTLFQPNGNIADKISYEKAPRGESYNRIDNSWLWSGVLTPGAANVIPGQSPEKENSTSANEEQLAAVGPITEKLGGTTTNEEKISKSKLPFLIAGAIAIFSGISILFLKKKSKSEN